MIETAIQSPAARAASRWLLPKLAFLFLLSGISGLVVGTKKPLCLDRAAFERRLQDPATRAVFELLGINSFDALLGNYMKHVQINIAARQGLATAAVFA